MNAEAMQIEWAITSFIEFFVKSMKKMSAQDPEGAFTEEQLDQLAAMLNVIKTMYVAQITMANILKDAGVDASGMEEL